MCSFKWFSVVVFLLLAAARFSHAGIEELPELMEWKKKHHGHALVLAFDRSHGEAPIPMPSQPPSASDMERINKYIEDLKGLKLAIEPTATQAVRREGGFNPFPMGSPPHDVPSFPGGMPRPRFDGGMPPMFGGKPPGDMREMMELMQWKASHQNHALVKEFERTHKEPRPAPGQPPSPADLESMKKYMADLKALKKAVESPVSQPIPRPVAQPVVKPIAKKESDPLVLSVSKKAQPQRLNIKRAVEHSDTVKPRKTAAKKLQTTSDSCETDSGSHLQSKIEELQLQVVHLSEKLDERREIPSFPGPFPGSFPLEGMKSMGGSRELPAPKEDLEKQERIQKRLVSQEVNKIEEEIKDVKEESDDYRDRACSPAGGGRGFGGPQGGGFPGGPGGPDMGDDDAGGFSPMRGRPPRFGSSNMPGKMPGFPGGPGMDLTTLMLDLPDDLQRQIDSANRDLKEAKSRLRTQRTNWRKRCREQAKSRPEMGGGMRMMGGMSPMMMGGGMGMMGGMSPMMMGGGMGMMGGMSPMMMGGGMGMMGGMSPMMMGGGMGMMGGMPPMMMGGGMGMMGGMPPMMMGR